MALLIDLFGYLSVLLHGLTIVAQSMALGGAVFLVSLARPLAPRIPDGDGLARRIARLAGWAALALVLCEAGKLLMQGAVLEETLGLGAAGVAGASFAVAGLAKTAGALALAALLLGVPRAPAAALLGAGGVVLGAATMTTHAAARLEGAVPLLAASALHILGAAVWIGGIPSFVVALRRVHDGDALRRMSARFSRMSMAGVGCILLSAAAFAPAYIGSWDALYGTAYGVMVSAKLALFAALLLLGLGNFLVVERLRRDPATPVLRMRRFAEAEIGIGVTLFFAAASLTSVPPSVDLVQDRVTLAEIAERNAPRPPRLASPDRDTLALPALQSRLDREAEQTRAASASAFTPGAGALPPRNAADVAWSEYNHHWAGLFVGLIGGLALLHRAGVGWARHWPLVFLGLAAFLFVRADPEAWPLGRIGFFESLRDVEVLQHRVFVVLIAAFAFFEWGVRTGRLRRPGAALVFPVVTAVGAGLLLTHSHAIGNVKEQLLIELSHTPLALAGVGAGWARWLEVRLHGRVSRAMGWVWPVCFLVVAAVLLLYREA